MKTPERRSGSIESIDTLLAIKAIGLAEGLTANDRRVAVSLIEHFRRRDGRCDPGLSRIASLLGISVRTVIRCVNRLVAAGLVRKVRHGGLGNRNSYKPNWQRLGELEEDWRKRFKRKPASSPTNMSPGDGQNCHLGNDNCVTQTYRLNPPQQTSLRSLQGGVVSKGDRFDAPGLTAEGSSSRSAARVEAERRWSSDLHREFAALPVTYGEIIGLIDVAIQTAATDAELHRRGTGIEYIRRELKLGGQRHGR
jgi:hypothetical protein